MFHLGNWGELGPIVSTSPMKSNKKVVILTEGQVKSLMDNLRLKRDERILSEINSLSNKQSKVI